MRNHFLRTAKSRGYDIVTSGIALYLDAANPSSYSGTGTTWNDLSGNSYNASLQNGVAYNAAGYFVFDGVNDWANLGNASVINWSAIKTVSFSFYVSAVAGHLLSMWDLAGGINQRSIIHTLSGGKLMQYWSINGINDSTIISTTSNIATNTWYTCTSVFGNGVRELWLNASLETQISQASIYTGATTSRLGYFAVPGRSSESPTGFASGRGGQVLLYSHALSQSEITQNHQAIIAKYP